MLFYHAYMKGVGNFQTIFENVIYYKKLNIDCLWLSDFMNEDEINFVYGNLEEFKKMIERLHQQNINVIIDLAKAENNFIDFWLNVGVDGFFIDGVVQPDLVRTEIDFRDSLTLIDVGDDEQLINEARNKFQYVVDYQFSKQDPLKITCIETLKENQVSFCSPSQFSTNYDYNLFLSTIFLLQSGSKIIHYGDEQNMKSDSSYRKADRNFNWLNTNENYLHWYRTCTFYSKYGVEETKVNKTERYLYINKGTFECEIDLTTYDISFEEINPNIRIKLNYLTDKYTSLYIDHTGLHLNGIFNNISISLFKLKKWCYDRPIEECELTYTNKSNVDKTIVIHITETDFKNLNNSLRLTIIRQLLVQKIYSNYEEAKSTLDKLTVRHNSYTTKPNLEYF